MGGAVAGAASGSAASIGAAPASMAAAGAAPDAGGLVPVLDPDARTIATAEIATTAAAAPTMSPVLRCGPATVPVIGPAGGTPGTMYPGTVGGCDGAAVAVFAAAAAN